MRSGTAFLLVMALGCGDEPVTVDDDDDRTGDDASANDAGSGNGDARISGTKDAAPDAAQAPKADAAQSGAHDDSGDRDARALVADSAVCSNRYYLDNDGDSFGDPKSLVTACSQPSGYVTNDADCFDESDVVKPGQKGRFTTHRGDGSFDYDCDGVERPLNPRVASVPEFSASDCPPPPKQEPGEDCDYLAQAAYWRVLTDGWYQRVAACGTSGPYGPGCGLAWDDGTRSFKCVPFLPADKQQLCN